MILYLLKQMDLYFFFFHTGLILFNSFGWCFKKTRKWNLITLVATAFSWFVLGIWFGWGYCLCTDWHWDVRRQLGYTDQTYSYIDFLMIKLIGQDFSDHLIEWFTVGVFASSTALSIALNIRDLVKRGN